MDEESVNGTEDDAPIAEWIQHALERRDERIKHGCLSQVRWFNVYVGGDTLSPGEEAHVSGCARCQRIKEIYSRESGAEVATENWTTNLDWEPSDAPWTWLTDLGIAGTAGAALMGSPDGGGIHLEFPVGTAVGTDRPDFRWGPTPGADRYVVEVYMVDPDDSLEEFVTQGEATGATTWRPDAPLPCGEVLQWQAFAYAGPQQVASGPGPGEAPARFIVLDDVQLATLSGKERGASSPLKRARVLLSFGLLHEAEDILKPIATGPDGTERLAALDWLSRLEDLNPST